MCVINHTDRTAVLSDIQAYFSEKNTPTDKIAVGKSKGYWKTAA
jgi:hypothetical protein